MKNNMRKIEKMNLKELKELHTQVGGLISKREIDLSNIVCA